jgi:hypothetical protein
MVRMVGVAVALMLVDPDAVTDPPLMHPRTSPEASDAFRLHAALKFVLIVIAGVIVARAVFPVASCAVGYIVAP